MNRVRMTMAQAVVKFLDQQYISLDGVESKFIEGVFTIFGHGCCVGLGEALSRDDHSLTVYQGHNEQGMAHAAIAYAKEKNRRGIIPCISSIGPGATNMVTAAAVASVNRIPALFIAGDVFACRQPDPVLQQIEVPSDLTVSVNDAFKPVCHFWDRISRPEQVMTSLLNAFRVLTDPRETGAVCLSLPQDVQGEAYDYPVEFFKKRVHVIKRYLPAEQDITYLAQKLQSAQNPVLICGGGVRYSEAHDALAALIDQLNIPVVETQAGKSVILHNHPLNLGGLGVTGSLSANKIIKTADLIIAVGTRLGDFTTASKSAFANTQAELVTINVQPYDAIKLDSYGIVSDAKVALTNLLQHFQTQAPDYRVPSEQVEMAKRYKAEWESEKQKLYERMFEDGYSQMQVLRELNQTIPEDAIVVAASGSLPADMERLWEAKHRDTYHLEYGFSCMGYEVAGALGAKLAHPQREVFAIVGDGAYILMHSELFTSIQEQAKINIVLFDNSGFHCIDNLQQAQGIKNFACEFRFRETHTRGLTGKPIPVDYAMNAQSYGCNVWKVTTESELKSALSAAAESAVSTLIDIKVAKKSMTDGYESWWRVGTPEVSLQEKTQAKYEELVRTRTSALRDY